MKKKLLIVVNEAEFFLSHRLPIAISARQAGFDVHIASRAGVSVENIRHHGFEHHELDLTRSGLNPCRELYSFISILKLFLRLKPDIVHLVTIKPVLYGGIAARLAGVPGVLAAVSGLGYIFTSQGYRAGALRAVIAIFYRIAFGKKNLRVIFQNPDDRDIFLTINALDSSKVVMLRGSGIDLTRYNVKPEPAGIPVVCLAARLLRDKGVFEFVDAARQLRDEGIGVRFVLAGSVDDGNPTSVTHEQLEAWRADELIELVGHVQDIPTLFSKANVIVLPSYREGLPKVLIEAAAAGRAVITTDVPGCRHAIEPDVTGLLVPARDSTSLAEAIKQLLHNPSMRNKMAIAGRSLAEREYDLEGVVATHLNIYCDLVHGTQ